jgi:hypothetical protein
LYACESQTNFDTIINRQHRRELGEVSKKAGLAELEWEHQRKQLLETIGGKSLD